MHWVIQENLFNEKEYDAFITTLDRLEITYTVVKVVPFSHELIPDIQPTGHVFVYGSTALANIACERNWYPGSFYNKNHDYRVWQQHYGKYLLNYESRVCKFKDVEHVWDWFFIRPCGDTKTFSGKVMTWDEFAAWQHKVLDLHETYTTLDGDTMVAYSPEQEIWAEYRFYVIDGQIVGSSLYKRGDVVMYDSCVDQVVTDFAKLMIDIWQPARGFVIDVALTENGYKIVEINCLNSAGLYAVNVQKLIEAIENMNLESKSDDYGPGLFQS